ncbi:unnamed protein product [Trichobilharzia szidati]|nr:unnamed protein product [Trichobilharzia szidati]
MDALALGDNGDQPALLISVDIKNLFDGIMFSHRYTSWVQVEDALSQMESATHTHYVIKKCIRDHESQELKYKLVVFRCTYSMKRKTRGSGLRVKPAKYTGCQSGFRIRYKEDEFIISSAETVHNRKCEKSLMIGDPYFRRLSGDEKENIAPVVKTTSEVADVLEYAEENFSKVLTSTDVYNLRKDVRPAMPLRSDFMRIIRQSGQVVEYVDSNTGITSRICFALESQVQLYRKYGEVVTAYTCTKWIIPILLVPAEYLGHKEYLARICCYVTLKFLSLQLTK